MAGHRVTTEAHGDAQLAAYLAAVAARLRGPRRCREAILAELSDGLDQAAYDHRAAGLPPGAAAATAIARFGAPQAVADGFAGELAISYTRRLIVWFLATGPLVGVWWLLVLRSEPWRTGVVGLLAAIPVLPLIAVAIVTGGGTVGTTGGLMRWLPETGPHRALVAASAIAVLSIIGDLTMIGVFLASGRPASLLGAVAIAASSTRMAASLTALRRMPWPRSR
ncbi:permease prefix domain 1-containing protein [Actinoplanes sp. NPDC051633]|uniref:permease prefix domain 1-containing protein n=1 Tax=Actinoplanes sp. NPDC051633 TaxID=3155670 RepID=UPI0034224086